MAEIKSPMYGLHFTKDIELKGRWFCRSEYADSYREQDGYAVILEHKMHYWLYDTISYHKGNTSAIYHIVPRWLENIGYIIDYDTISVSYPNPILADSTKALMKQRRCNVSVALVTRNGDYPTEKEYVVINEECREGTYKTTICYLLK